MLPQNRTESAPSCPKMGTLPKTQSSPAQERNPRSSESDRISPIMSENGMKRALKRLLGLCMADSALCFFLSGLYMARAPRYPRYGRCNSAPPYSAYHVSGATYKPLSISTPHESAIHRRDNVPPTPSPLCPAQPQPQYSTIAPYSPNKRPIPHHHHPHSQKTFRKMPPLFKPHSTKPVGSRTALLPEATTDGHRRQPAAPTTDAPTIAGASASSHRPQATSRHNPATQNNKIISTTPSNRRRQQRQHPDHAEPHPM